MRISSEFIDIIKYLAHKDPDIIFCGSFGLSVNGLINRKIRDLDVITNKKYKQLFELYDIGNFRTKHESSHIFNFDDEEVIVETMDINGIRVDFFNVNRNVEYKKFRLQDGTIIKVETPEYAINVKKQYIKLNPNEEVFLKHFADLVNCGISTNEIADIIKQRKEFLIS